MVMVRRRVDPLLATRLESLRGRFADAAKRCRADCLLAQETPTHLIGPEPQAIDDLGSWFCRMCPCEDVPVVWKKRLVAPDERRWKLNRWLVVVWPFLGHEEDLLTIGADASTLLCEAGWQPRPSWFTPKSVWDQAADCLWWHFLVERALSRPHRRRWERPEYWLGDPKRKVANARIDWQKVSIPWFVVMVNDVARQSVELIEEITAAGFETVRDNFHERNRNARPLMQWDTMEADLAYRHEWERPEDCLAEFTFPVESGESSPGATATQTPDGRAGNKRGPKRAPPETIGNVCEVLIAWKRDGRGPTDFCEWWNGDKTVGRIGSRWINAKVTWIKKLMREQPERIPAEYSNDLATLFPVKRVTRNANKKPRRSS